jgi:hypothetical protein
VASRLLLDFLAVALLQLRGPVSDSHPEGILREQSVKGVPMGIVWTVLAIIGLIVVLQWLF